MASKQSTFIVLGLVLFIGGIIFLSRAVEPPRETAVDVLDNNRFER